MNIEKQIGSSYQLGTESISTSYTFAELRQNTTYNFKVTVADRAGNIEERLLTATTGGLEEGETALKFGTPSWSSEKASITVNKVSENTLGLIQYQVKTVGNELSENNWEEYSISISNLNHGDVVYARLWDGTNAGSTTSFEILDTAAPTSPTLQITAGTSGTNGWYTSDVTVTITGGTDLQGGVARTTYTITGAGEKAETQVTSGASISIETDGASTITAYTYDKAGNKSEETSLEVKKDSTKPKAFEAKAENLTPTGFTLTGTATDTTSGIATELYEYYLDNVKQVSNIITDKEPDTKYTCYIRAYDKAGNYIDSASKEVTLGVWRELPSVTSDGSWNEEKKVNSPKLADEMTALIQFNEEGEDWYDYKDQGTHRVDGKTSKWANAKTTDGSHWVWIPRYEYRIVSGEHTSTAGQIEVKFIKTSQTTADPGYKIHPAFVADTEVGGFEEELAGIWVGKYESSHADATASSDGSSSTMKVLPRVRSWRNITISDIYTKSYNYNRTLESHQMKNSEWGAVAYLAHSQYGRNGNEVTINNNSSCITGMGGNSVSEAESTVTNAYYTAKGQLASTTGNIYGVYDMSGGANEYTAAYSDNGHATLTTYGSAVVNAPTKYKNVYVKGSVDSQEKNYVTNSGKYGDAVYETSSNGGSPWYSSWFQDFSSFPYTAWTIFFRGGCYANKNSAGIFAFLDYNGGHNGHAHNTIGFRVTLCVK